MGTFICSTHDYCGTHRSDPNSQHKLMRFGHRASNCKAQHFLNCFFFQKRHTFCGRSERTLAWIANLNKLLTAVFTHKENGDSIHPVHHILETSLCLDEQSLNARSIIALHPNPDDLWGFDHVPFMLSQHSVSFSSLRFEKKFVYKKRNVIWSPWLREDVVFRNRRAKIWAAWLEKKTTARLMKNWRRDLTKNWRHKLRKQWLPDKKIDETS